MIAFAAFNHTFEHSEGFRLFAAPCTANLHTRLAPQGVSLSTRQAQWHLRVEPMHLAACISGRRCRLLTPSRPGLRGAAIAPHLVIIRVTVTMADVTVGIGTGRYFGGPLTGGGFAKRSSPFG